MHFFSVTLFRKTLGKVARALQALGAEWDFREELRNTENSNMSQFSQPLCTCLQIALFELLSSWNITPIAVVGHSSGEIAAAYAIGAPSLEAACAVAYHRGKLAGQLAISASGAIISVNLAEDAVPAYLSKVPVQNDVHVAWVNSPLNTTLFGHTADIDILKAHIDEDRIFAQKSLLEWPITRL